MKKSIQLTGMHIERYDRAVVNFRIIIAVFLLAALLFVGGASAETYSGSCGASDLTWTLDTDTGVLEIAGTGKMPNYYSTSTNYGWFRYRDTITSVSIGSGVTSIGDRAFEYCSYITSIKMGNNVTSIGDYSFFGCNNLTSVVIPDSVTSIGYLAFSRCASLTSVTIGNSVTSIGEDTFYGCTSLTSVTIGNSVTSIGVKAFSGCTSLTSVTIGHSVTSIGAWTFQDCNSLTSVVIPESVTSIGYLAFGDCTALTSVVIPESVTSIGDYAFSGCSSLTSVIIPDTLTYIGDWAFKDCTNLTSVVIPDNVTSIRGGLFYDCTSLTSVEIPDSVTSIEIRAFSGCTSLTSVVIPDSITSIGVETFSGCTSLKTVTVGNGVTTIGQSAFSGCTSLTSVVIPDSVTSIGDKAFSKCTSLKTVTVGNGVTTIGQSAFSGCTNLQAVDLNNTTALSSVGNDAFGSTSYNAMKFGSMINVSYKRTASLLIDGTNYYAPNTHIIVMYSLPEITYTIKYDSNGGTGSMDDQTFTYNTSQILSPNTFVKNENEFSGWSTTADGTVVYTDEESVINLLAIHGATLTLYAVWTPIIPATYSGTCGDGLTWTLYTDTGVLEIAGTGKMPNYSTSTSTGWYQYRDIIKTVNIDTGVTSIGKYAFSACNNLTSVIIPDSVTSIGDFAFTSCGSLTSVTIGNNVTSIGKYAFSGCKNLTSVIIPDSVTSIGVKAFYGCTSLTSVTIGNNVTSIGDYAFTSCGTLTSVTIGNNVTSIGVETFSGCTSLKTVTVGNGVTTIGQSAFSGCTSLTSVVIPDSVTIIRGYAFNGCTALTSVTIGNGVTNIVDYAFYGCTNLQVVDLSDTTALSHVGKYAFGSGRYSALKSGSVIYVSDEHTAALFIHGTNYYSPNTSIIVGKPGQEITYTIKYDANGGTGSMADQTFTYNTTQSLSSNAFVKEEHDFSGWSTSAEGPVVFIDGQSVRNLLDTEGATLTLYAVWLKNENTPLASISLTQGWNFISVPKTLNASNNTAGSLFGSVETNNKNILAYNAQTRTWAPILNQNEIIQPLNGYWIYSANQTTITLTYPSDPASPSMKILYPGWNAIGLSSAEPASARSALAGTSWRTIIPWNLADGSYDSAIVNGGSDANSPDRLMTPGNGYWVYVDTQSTMTGLTA